jgi:hypothetical protein
MIEIIGKDIWTYPAEAFVLTTNGDINSKGKAVMGRGIALQAKNRFARIDLDLAVAIEKAGNHVHHLKTYKDRKDNITRRIISFPVKHHWHEKADMNLIRRSANELRELVDYNCWEKVAMPRPGCGAGLLEWSNVRMLLKDILDDRFVVVEKEGI